MPQNSVFQNVPVPPEKAFAVGDDAIVFNVPRDPGVKVDRSWIILDGSITVGVGGGAAGTPKGLIGPAGLIKKIKVTANSASARYVGGDIVDCSPLSLLFDDLLQTTKLQGVMPAPGDLAGQTFTPGGGAYLDPGVYPIHVEIPINWADFNYRRSYATSLNVDPFAYKSIQVKVSTGDLTYQSTGCTRTLDATLLKVSYRDERFLRPGDTYVKVMQDHRSPLDVTREDFVDDALPKTGDFLQWLVFGEAGAAQTMSDALLNKIVIASSKWSGEIKWQSVRQNMFSDGWYDRAQVATGQFFLDFTNGAIENAIPAASLSATFDVNFTGAGDALRLFSKRVYQPAQYNALQMPEYATK